MAPNLFDDIPLAGPDEHVETLLETAAFRLERIVSRGHASTPGSWYDQEEDEWVVLLSGRARLRFEEEPVAREFRPGDHVLVPAHHRHRVEWTTPDEPTIWLALHWRTTR